MGVDPAFERRQVALDRRWERESEGRQRPCVQRGQPGVGAHLGGGHPVAQQRVVAGDDRPRCERLRPRRARPAVAPRQRGDHVEVRWYVTEEVADDLGRVTPGLVVVGDVAERKQAEQVVQAEGVAVHLIGRGGGDVDAEGGVEPARRQLRPLEAALERHRGRTELVGEVDDVVHVPGIGDEPEADEIGHDDRVTVGQPAVVVGGRRAQRHVGVAGLGEHVDQGVEDRRIGTGRRAREPLTHGHEHHDRHVGRIVVVRGGCCRRQRLPEAGSFEGVLEQMASAA